MICWTNILYYISEFKILLAGLSAVFRQQSPKFILYFVNITGLLSLKQHLNRPPTHRRVIRHSASIPTFCHVIFTANRSHKPLGHPPPWFAEIYIVICKDYMSPFIKAAFTQTSTSSPSHSTFRLYSCLYPCFFLHFLFHSYSPPPTGYFLAWLANIYILCCK